MTKPYRYRSSCARWKNTKTISTWNKLQSNLYFNFYLYICIYLYLYLYLYVCVCNYIKMGYTALVYTFCIFYFYSCNYHCKVLFLSQIPQITNFIQKPTFYPLNYYHVNFKKRCFRTFYYNVFQFVSILSWCW